jgi:hypothetical protein
MRVKTEIRVAGDVAFDLDIAFLFSLSGLVERRSYAASHR